MSANCFDFVDITHLPRCYSGTFLCIGETDANCKHGENQLQLHLKSQGQDPRRQLLQAALKFENEGSTGSRIETIWIEDEYKLLKNFFTVSPIVGSPGIKYRMLSNNTVFADALAHKVPFDQHFVATCLDDAKRMRRQENADTPTCVHNSETQKKHDSVSLVFDTECSIEELEEAVSYGLLRIGVSMGGFPDRPRKKSFVSCQDVIDVTDFDPKNLWSNEIDIVDWNEDYYEDQIANAQEILEAPHPGLVDEQMHEAVTSQQRLRAMRQ